MAGWMDRKNQEQIYTGLLKGINEHHECSFVTMFYGSDVGVVQKLAALIAYSYCRNKNSPGSLILKQHRHVLARLSAEALLIHHVHTRGV